MLKLPNTQNIEVCTCVCTDMYMYMYVQVNMDQYPNIEVSRFAHQFCCMVLPAYDIHMYIHVYIV